MTSISVDCLIKMRRPLSSIEEWEMTPIQELDIEPLGDAIWFALCSLSGKALVIGKERSEQILLLKLMQLARPQSFTLRKIIKLQAGSHSRRKSLIYAPNRVFSKFFPLRLSHLNLAIANSDSASS